MQDRIAEIRALVEYARSRVNSVMYAVPHGSTLYYTLRDAYDKLDSAGDEVRLAWLAAQEPTGHAPAAGEEG